MPSPAEVDNFQELIDRLAVLAVGAVTAMWNTTQDWQEVEEQYPTVIDPYAAAAAILSAEWYHSLAPDAPFAVETAPPKPVEQLTANVGYAFSRSDPLQTLKDITHRHVFDASGETVVHNAIRENVRYARQAKPDACAWCRMLALRGAVYHSEETAARSVSKRHDGTCKCTILPVRRGDTYHLPAYMDETKRQYETAREAVGGNTDDIVNYMRRQETSPTPGD